MTLTEERALRQQAEGYWAMEVRLADSHAPRPMYICHTANDHAAGRIFGQLMGPTNAAHGFNYYRLELPIANRPTSGLPALGGWDSVSAASWPDLMLAHAASEAAFDQHLRQGKKSATTTGKATPKPSTRKAAGA
jgi:hypothetical protein